MAVRVSDTIKAQNDLTTFPIAYSEDIWLDKNKGSGETDYADLQTIFNEGGLGGDSLPTPESKDKLLITTENAETSELEWTQIDKSEVGDIIHEYTLDEWEALSEDDKPPVGSKVIIKNDTEESMIDDESVSSSKVWSSRKVFDELEGTTANFNLKTYSDFSQLDIDINLISTLQELISYLPTNTVIIIGVTSAIRDKLYSIGAIPSVSNGSLIIECKTYICFEFRSWSSTDSLVYKKIANTSGSAGDWKKVATIDNTTSSANTVYSSSIFTNLLTKTATTNGAGLFSLGLNKSDYIIVGLFADYANSTSYRTYLVTNASGVYYVQITSAKDASVVANQSMTVHYVAIPR